MALTIDFQGNVTLMDGQDIEIVPDREGRRAIILQLQCAGVIWMKFNEPASVGDGILLEAGQRFEMPNGFPDEMSPGNDYFEGSIHAYYDRPSTTGVAEIADLVIRVVEFS